MAISTNPTIYRILYRNIRALVLYNVTLCGQLRVMNDVYGKYCKPENEMNVLLGHLHAYIG